MTRALALLVWMSSACERPVVVEPGPVRDLTVQLKLLELEEGERSALGSFDIEIRRDGVVVGETAISYNASTGELTFLDGPPQVLGGGVLEVSFAAIGIDGQPRDIGGRTLPIDLDDANAAAEARVLIGRLDTFTASAPLVTARFLHSATAAGPGAFLVVGGATSGDENAPAALATDVEWIAPFRGEHCTSSGQGGCSFGDVPAQRIEHVAVDLDASFAAECPQRGVLIAGGRGGAGQVLDDLYLFDPTKITTADGAFKRLPALPRARRGAGAAAHAQCRVIIAGGAGADGAPIAEIDVVDLSAAEPVVSTVASLDAPGIRPIVIATRNALQEIIIAGGVDENGAPVAAAASLTLADDAATLCSLSDAGCNGAAAAPRCPRGNAALARLDAAPELSPTLIVGGGDCVEPVEVYRASVSAPFHAFAQLDAGGGLNRVGGATASALRGGSALLVGGRDASGAIVGVAERFAPALPISETFAPLGGDFDDVGTDARAFHAAVVVEGAVFVVGGIGVGGGALDRVEVFIEDFR